MWFKKLPTAPAKPWHETILGGVKTCTTANNLLSARLKSTPFAGVWLFENDLPMRRFLAVQVALKNASFGLEAYELDDLLAGIYVKAHAQKNMAQLKTELQTDIDNIRQRMQATPEKMFEEIALPCMVLEGENPFLYDSAFDDAKRTVLAEQSAADFFLGSARALLSGYLTA